MSSLSILAFLKRLPWDKIALALGLISLGLVIWRAPWAFSRGRHSRDAEVAGLVRDNATLAANAETLRASIRQQNEALLAARAESDAKVAAGAKALAEAQKVSAGLAAQASSLRASGARKRSDDEPCQISKTLAGVKL